MAKHVRFPSLLASFASFRAEDAVDAVNTTAYKVGGSEYGPMLSEILPLVNALAIANALPPVEDLYFGEKKKCGRLAKTLYVLVGRSESSHARGKKLLTGLVGVEGDTSSATIVAEGSRKAAERIREAYATLKAAPATKPISDKGRKAK